MSTLTYVKASGMEIVIGNSLANREAAEAAGWKLKKTLIPQSIPDVPRATFLQKAKQWLQSMT